MALEASDATGALTWLSTQTPKVVRELRAHLSSNASHFDGRAHHPMRTKLIDHIRAFFARDRNAYWWHHFTDEEKELRRMDVWQLAKAINDARVRNLAGEAEKLIVADHMLAERLARIQARPGYIAAVAGLVGVVAGAFLTSALQRPDAQLKCACECRNGDLVQQKAAAPVQDTHSSVVKPGVPKDTDAQTKSKQDGKPTVK